MFQPDGRNRRVFVMESALLFCGIFISISMCHSTNTSCRLRDENQYENILMLMPPQGYSYPSKPVYKNNTLKLCFMKANMNQHADCCNNSRFDSNFESEWTADRQILTLENQTLAHQDILVFRRQPTQKCIGHRVDGSHSGFLYYVHKCFDDGSADLVVRLSQDNLCGESYNYNKTSCKDANQTQFKITISHNNEISCMSCKPPKVLHFVNNNTNHQEKAKEIINNIGPILEKMGDSDFVEVVIGDVKGQIAKIHPNNPSSINFYISASNDDETDNNPGLSRAVKIPEEAIKMAVEGNGSYAAALLFRGLQQNDSRSSFVNDEALGITMGAEICNLSRPIEIAYKNVNRNGDIPSCVSWDGQGDANWTTDGCEIKDINDTITCQCSHLTFFAVLMSPPYQNISTSDLTNLSYITSVGCGMSLFFLGVALFMHFLIRKQKSGDTTRILINLLVAMFNLNLTFLTNESIAKLDIFGACVTIAVVLHYSLLATFSWFFMEALHLYFTLWKLSTSIKHYMVKICIAGWVTPCAVVIALLADGKYGFLVIHTDDGNSAKMCWISDFAVHQGVNIGYYAVVFIFTFTVFIITVRQILILQPKASKAKDMTSIKANSFSILGLFLLLGITWAFAFFGYGPLRIPSYYIFTILNSFQGFFLFIYYYNSSKTVKEDRNVSSDTSGTNTIVNPFQ